MMRTKGSRHHYTPLRRRQSPIIESIILVVFILTGLFNPPFVCAKGANKDEEKEPQKVYTNRLIKSADPYLLLHAHNPVDWYAWGPETLEKARSENKPIFLSIGYSTCYWCHVAERELYSDPRIAELMNKWFVNIKVDREERPDLDRVYMRAREILTGYGGWPNNVFFTPELKPFFAGSYFSPEARAGRSGFPDVLRSIHKAWTSDHARVEKVTGEVYAMLQKAGEAGAPLSGTTPDIKKWLHEAIRESAISFDEREGGFANGPTRFPKALLLFMLISSYSEDHNEKTLKMATDTLSAMATGGIMDQLGGGFHRYSTEPIWSVPHFEKMLNDNAQLLGLYARAYTITKRPLFKNVALLTAKFLTEEMQAQGGGFYSALDAESGGVEGASYVWTEEEIESVLGAKEARRFFRLYFLTPMLPALAGHRQAHGGVLRIKPERAREFAATKRLTTEIDALAPLREKLLKTRTTRAQPARDEKIVTADNALAVMGFTMAGSALHDDKLMHVALNTATLLWEHAHDEKTGEISHQFFHGHRGGPGFLGDYALLGEACVGLYRSTGRGIWLTRARQLADSMLKRFVLANGALSLSWDRSNLPVLAPLDGDAEKPSDRSAALGLLLDLSAEAHEPAYLMAALRALQGLEANISAGPLSWPALLGALQRQKLREVSIAAGNTRFGAVDKKTTDSASYIRASARWASSGSDEALLVKISMDPGYHINSNPASTPYLVPTELTIECHPEAKVNYPLSKTFKAEFAKEGIVVYDGSIIIRAQIANISSSLPVTVDLKVQACTETMEFLLSRGSAMKLPVLYTVNDVAKALRASRSAVYEWVSLDKIPYVKINGLVRFRAAEIDKWLEGGHGGPVMGRRK